MRRRAVLADLLALRYRVPDGTLLDALDLAQLVPELPGQVRTADLRRRWCCSQPTVSRSMSRLWDAGLIDYRAARGCYRIRRIGPTGADF